MPLLGLLACATQEVFEYPTARRSDQVDVYHGVEVPDPYRWLEDGESDETRAWIEAQNELTARYLEGIEAREPIRRRLEQLWNYERFGVPTRRSGHTFYTRNDGLQDQSVLYLSSRQGGEDRVLLDPNTFSPDGTIALSGHTASWDGRLLAYATSDGGSDWRTWQVMEIESGRKLGDVISGNKFGGVAWNATSDGLYYTRYDRVDEGQELVAKNSNPDIYLHHLGTPESEDRLVLARPDDAEVFQGFSLSQDRRSLIVSRWQTSTRHDELYLMPVSGTGAGQLRPIATGFDAEYSYLGDDGSRMWVQTNLGSPRGRVVAIDMAAPEREGWVDVIPESEHALQGVSLVGRRLIVVTMQDATSRVHVYDTEGNLERELELPGLGTASGFGGELDDPLCYYSFTSFTQPPTIYSFRADTGESLLFREPRVAFDRDAYVTYQVFYKSADSKTRVPMFLTHREGLELDGQNPTYLYGYGGFNVSLTPFFSVPNLVWLELGGVLAVPNLRGGGEYGEEWHAAGTKRDKQNVFDDFEGAARYLVRNEYTTPRKLAIAGNSNGGLLVGACLNQNPWLYGAALPGVGVMDMLRYHLFTIGWAWAGDYGTVEDQNEFHALLAYSPLHNVKPRRYPATMVTTADRDDRVVPAHSFKYGAALQAAQRGEAPILMRIETRAGHGAGKPTSKRIDEAADRLGFLYNELGLEYYELLEYERVYGTQPREHTTPVFH